MSGNNFPTCARKAGIFRRWNSFSKKPEFKSVGFPCGKKSCEYCRNRKRSKLLKRLRAADFGNTVIFWTITTDPKVLDPVEALKSMSRRWHVVHRSLLRLCPKLQYFKVLEWTKSGLPHLHLITSNFLAWDDFQRLLRQQKFGEVLHFQRLPTRVALTYATKYLTKSIYELNYPADYGGRLWTASLRFLPMISYGDCRGDWHLVWIDRADDRVEIMESAYRMHYTDPSPPEYPW